MVRSLVHKVLNILFLWDDETYWAKGTTNKEKIKAIGGDAFFVIIGLLAFTGPILLLMYITFFL